MSGNAELAELGLKLDANGFVENARQATGALFGLGDSAGKTQQKIQNLATAGGFALGTLASGGAAKIETLLRSLSGLGFAFGPLTGTATLTASTIALAFTESFRKVREESKQMADDLMKDARRLSEFSKQALLERQSLLERQRESLMKAIEMQGKPTGAHPDLSTSAGRMAFGMADPAKKATFFFPTVSAEEARKLYEYDAALREVKGSLEAIAEAEKKAAKEAGKKSDAHEADVERELAAEEERRAERKADFIKRMAEMGARVEEETTRGQIEGAQAIADAEWDSIESMMRALQKLDEERERFHKAEMDRKQREEEKQQQIIEGAFAGMFGGAIRQIGGPLGGAAGGALTALTAGANPAGIAAAGFAGLIDGLMNSGEEARRVAQQLQAMANETASYTDQLEVLLGVTSSVEARLRAINREYAHQRDALHALLSEDIVQKSDDLSKQLQAQLKAINELEQARVDLLREETRQMNITMGEDLRVRLLRLQGMDDEADRYQLMIEHSREYQQALEAGADATNLATLAEVHRLETLDLAMSKIQRRIDSLAGTINGLQDFRNSLLVGATQSPAARLAEARRQYDEVLAIAQGEDLTKAQDAAGRLPGIAQILLDASRAVNASGSGFQSDFDKVLADSQALIERFQDLKTIEELQLEELIKIREGQYHLNEVILRPIGTLPADPTRPHPTPTDPNTGLLQEGFQQTVARLGEVVGELNELQDDIRHLRETIGASFG